MNRESATLFRSYRLAAACAVIASAVACSNGSPTVDVPTPQPSVAGDTVPGTGQLSELQQRRAAWVGRKIDNYRFQLRISCFCAGEITRPVNIEVKQGAVVSVVDVETNKPVTNKMLYPTVTALFDAAIAERSKGGNVSVAYDRTLGIPVRLEVGTIANDAGVLYFVQAFVAPS